MAEKKSPRTASAAGKKPAVPVPVLPPVSAPVPGTAPLGLPPANLNSRKLPIENVNPRDLYRISDHEKNEPHFGASGEKRFDDPNKVIGTCYLGKSLEVAFAESVLHDRVPDATGFSLPTTEVERRYVHRFKAANGSGTLRLAQVYGTPFLLLDGNLEISGTHDYTVPQAWAMAIAAHPDQVDGLIYFSRKVGDFAVVLFRRNPKDVLGIQSDVVEKLPLCNGYQDTKTAFHITLT